MAAPPTLARVLIGLLVGTAPLPPQALGQDTDPRIQRVERRISGSLQVQGRVPEVFTLQERMAHYNVPEVSIAVLEGGRIAWAKGYGVKDVTTGEPITPETLSRPPP